MNIEDFRRILSEFTGQRRGVFVHKIFIEMTGDLNAAAMLSQILYWSDKTKNPEGWFYKTTDEWQDEIGISYAQQRRAYKIIKPLGIQHRLKRVESGATKAHYRVDWDTFVEKTAQHLDFQLSRKSEKLNPITDNNNSNMLLESDSDSHRLPLSDKSDMPIEAPKPKNDVQPKPKPRHWTLEVIALECFGLQRDQIKQQAGHIAVIVNGSHKGNGEMGLLQYFYTVNKVTRESVTEDMDIKASQELTCAFAWWRRTKPGLDVPRAAYKIWKMLVDYRASLQPATKERNLDGSFKDGSPFEPIVTTTGRVITEPISPAIPDIRPVQRWANPPPQAKQEFDPTTIDLDTF